MEENKEINIAEAFGATEGRDQRFAIYIPNKDKRGKPVEQEKWVNKALLLLSEILRRGYGYAACQRGLA